MRTLIMRSLVPDSPHPGLRPFLDFDAPFFFGRDEQRDQIIARLKARQFVTVLGGSGSGKSSLIRAGVIPHLRAYGMPEAGDYWVPVVTRPGTNLARGPDGARRRASPIDRLARRFSQVLAPPPDEQAARAREQEIADILRQETGFKRFIKAFGSALAPDSGVDPASARFLVVIDQFEEIFHSSNHDVEDCRILVERLLDHFFDPDPRIFVALTMRSEHLNDCPAFLELPDAINATSYLIRRLDRFEIRAAIEEPARRYLRVLARTQRGAAREALPDSVEFEERVVTRLVRDVESVQHDPDHLPMLQHLLARLWEAACVREGSGCKAPARIEWQDLEHAVLADRRGRGLADSIDTLRASLENWPESLYRRLGKDEQRVLAQVLRRLAYKDPNTGLYTQQRLRVEEWSDALGLVTTPPKLRALLQQGFVGSVDYLFWDDEDEVNITLKVSHESFIRGWKRFRDLIDEEAERFEELRSALRSCETWREGGARDEDLISGSQLVRVKTSQVREMLEDPSRFDGLFEFIRLDRESERWLEQKEHIRGFVARSIEADYRRRNRSQRLVVGAAALAVPLIVAVSAAFYNYFVQSPALERATEYFDAAAISQSVRSQDEYFRADQPFVQLRTLIDAAYRVDPIRGGTTRSEHRFEPLLDALSWLPSVGRIQTLLAGVATSTEPEVNAKLRELMSSVAWDVALDERALGVIGAEDMGGGQRAERGECLVDDPRRDPNFTNRRKGVILVEAIPTATSSRRRRAVFLDRADNLSDATLRVADVDEKDPGRGCVSFQGLDIAHPLSLSPVFVFDANLRYLFVTTVRPYEGDRLEVFELLWEINEATGSRAIRTRRLASLHDPALVAEARRAGGELGLDRADTWRLPGGRAVRLGERIVRIVTSSAQRMTKKESGERWDTLGPPVTGSPCRRLADEITRRPNGLDRIDVLESLNDPRHCFAISRRPPTAAPATARDALARGLVPPAPEAEASAREEVAVAVYLKSGAGQARAVRALEGRGGDDSAVGAWLDSPIARARFSTILKSENDWSIGAPGSNVDGWIRVGRKRQHADRVPYSGMPWSTGALAELACVIQRSAVAGENTGAAEDPGARRGGLLPSVSIAFASTPSASRPARVECRGSAP